MRRSKKVGRGISFNSVISKTHYFLSFLILLSSQIAWSQPTTQVSGITFEPVPGANQNTTIKINWSTNGTGGVGRLVVLRDATGVFTPTSNVNTTTLNANADFSLASDLDAGAGVAKAVAVISGGAQTVTVSNIAANTTYIVQVYEFSDDASSPDYLLTSNNTNPRHFIFYTSNGTFTKPTNLTTVTIQALGGGGGGGGADSNGSQNRAGGGGAGGAYVINANVDVTSLPSAAVTVGLGGNGGEGGDDAPTLGTGATGGSSTFGALVSAPGGAGGLPGLGADRTGAGAATTAGGTHNGGAGGQAPPTGTTGSNATGSGAGGGSAGTTAAGGAAATNATVSTAGSGGANGGGSGASALTSLPANTHSVGIGATQFGGGGSGGWDNLDDANDATSGGTDPSDADGGAGASGYVIVSYDNTPPTAVITRGTPSSQYINATSVTFTVTFNESVTGVSPDGSDFTAVPSGGLSLTTPTIAVTGSNPYNVTVSTLAGEGDLDLNFSGGQDVKDASGNQFGGSTTGDQIYTRDVSLPAAAPIISVTTNPAGNVVPGYYNASNQGANAGLTIRVTVANDNSLNGGTIQVQADDQLAAGFVNLGAAGTISSTDITNGYKDISITHAQLAALAGGRYGNGKILSFRANITDGAANGPVNGATFGSTLTIDLVAPPAPPAPVLATASDSGSSNSDRNTNDNTPTFENAVGGSDGVLVTINSNLDGNVGSGTIASNDYSITVSTLQNGSHTITATTTDAAGNISSSASISVIIDTNGDPATGFGLTVDSGVPADLITNDDRFNAGTSANFTLELLEGATVLVTIPSATAGVNILNPTTPLSDGPHAISVRTTDIAGNTATVGPINVTIDTTNPSVAINQVADPAFTSALFNVVFNEPINVSSFVTGDFTAGNFNTGTQTGEVISSGPTEVAPNDGTTFQVGVTGTSTTPSTIILTLNALTITDIAGNPNGASTSTDNTITFTPQPTTPPTNLTFSAVSQFALTANRTGGNGTTYLLVGRQGAAVDFVPVDGTDYSANVNANFNGGTAIDGNGNKILALTNTAAINITGLNDNTTYHFALFALHGSGANSNYNPTARTGSQLTTTCSVPPAPTTLGSSANTSSVTLTFTRNNGNDDYLILFKSGGIPVSTPVGGVNYTTVDNLNFTLAGALGDAFVVFSGDPDNATSVSQTITNLNTGTLYGFRIYTYSGSTFCYNPTDLSGTIMTSASAAAELTIAAGAAAEPDFISSLGTALTGAVLPQTNAVQNFDFVIQDGADGANGFISQIVISKGANDQFTDWNEAISAVSLSDGTNTQTANITVGANTITIASIPNTVGTLGYIASTTSKTYTLTIALKTALGGTLPTTIDGKQFDFVVNTAGITTGVGSSTMAAAQTASSGLNKNVVTVAATKISVDTQPSAAAIANIALATQPQFRAQDANNNTDTGFGFALTVNTTPANLGPTSAPTNFTSGVANFTASGFKFLNPGTAAMNVTANSITSANTNSITVSSTTTLGAATGETPGGSFGNGATNIVALGFSLVTNGSAHNVTGLSFTTPVDPAALMTNFRIFSNSVNNFGTASNLGVAAPTSTGTTLDFSGLSIPINNTIKYFWLVADVRASYLIPTPANIDFALATAGITESIAGITKAGATQTGNTYTIQDAVAPTVVSISLPNANPNRTGTAEFTVTFSEAVVINDDLDFTFNGTAVTGTATHTGSGNVYTVSFSTISAEGTVGLIIVNDNSSIEDLAGNPLNAPPGGVASPSQYYVYVPEPSSSVTNFQITTTTTTSMTLTWTDVATFPPPTGYLIAVERSGATVGAPTDLSDYADQTDLIGNTTGYLTVAPGVQTATFTSLLSGSNYNFYIYPYTNSSPNIDYRTTAPATVSGATPVASSSGLFSSGSSFLITDISTLTTAFLTPTTQNPPTTPVPTPNFFWSFNEDSGSDVGPAGDNAKTLITGLTISAGPNNNISNWSDIIAEAKLRAFSGSLAAPTEDSFVTTTNITSNSIVFTGIPTGNDQTGEVDDNELRFYQLYIRFKNPIDNTNLLRETVDNKNFDFQVTNTSFTYATGSSQVNPATNINTNSGITRNIVRSTATELRFIQQPSNAYIGNAMSPLVSLEATDVYGTRDLNYATTVNINSTGTLSTAPTLVPMAAGLGSASVIHSHRGTNLTLTGSVTGLTSTPTSTAFDITVDNQSDIILDAAFVEPQNILYANYQSNNIATLPISSQGVTVARFTLRDGGGANDLDGSPTILKDITFNITNVNALRRVALYDGGIEIAELPAASPLTFSNINFSTLADNSNRNFTVVVTFQNTAAVITDNAQFRFTVAAATTTTNSSDFATSTAGGAQSSIAGNDNRIEVVANQYVFTNPVAAQNIFAGITATATGGFGTITVEARDANNVLDLDYAQTANITNAGTIPMTDNPPGASTSLTSIPYTFSAGVLTFSTGFKYDQPGDGTLRVTEQSPAPLPAAAIPQRISPTISVVVSSSSDIIADASFNPTDNINYLTYQAATIDLTSAGDELKVGQFLLRDGGADRPGTLNDTDNTTTELTAITFNVVNASFLNKLALYNQANVKVQEITVPPAATTVTFSGFAANSIVAADGGDISFSLYATFNNTITDNQQIRFTVNSATANPLKSVLKNADGSTTLGSPALTSIAGNDNRVEVLATRLTYTTVPPTASINVPFAVTVTAQDINGNTDIDYQGTVNMGSYPTGNTAGFNTANLPSGPFTAGVLNYPVGFMFTSGNALTRLAISGSASNGAGPFTDQLSPLPGINVISSFESRIYTTMAPQAIPYINFQATNIDQTAINSGNAYIIEQLVLADGDADGVAGDLDGANTQLIDLTLGITNPQTIRQIGIYTRSGVTYNELGEVSGTSITVDGGGYGQVNFTGFTVDAVDPGGSATGTTTIYVVATFKGNNTDIIDNRVVQISVTDAQTGVGSKFRGAIGDPLGGVGNFVGGVLKVNPPSQIGSAVSGTVYAGSVGGANTIQVVATRLDFVQQPGNFAGINQPIDTTAIVHARDIYAVLDKDFGASATVSSAALTTPIVTAFNSGVLDLAFMQYTQSGNGKLDVTAGSLNSNSPSIICELVDVIHVNATKNTNGVVDGNKTNGNLKAATQNQVIFGFTLKPERVTTSQPKLKEFLIEFKTEYPPNTFQFPTPYKTASRTTLQNFRLRSSSAANPSASAATAVSNTIVDILQEERCSGCGFDRVRVRFKTAADYQALFNGTNSLTFYLVADVSSTANGSVQPMRPVLIDNGYNAFDGTNDNIKTTFGSATSNVLGTLYSFSTVKPPVLIASVPSNGQLNVDPGLDSVLLIFDTKVTSLDAIAILWDRATNLPIDTLEAIQGKFVDNAPNGVAPDLTSLVQDTLIFKVNVPLMADSLYYITVAKGKFNINDHSDRAGITDQDFNMFGGINFNGTLYFKAASPTPPKLISAWAYQYGQNWGMMQASFDKFGKAYYMILPSGSAAPTNAQIKGAPYLGTVLHRSSFKIEKLHPVINQTVIDASLGGNQNYDIWMYAENDALPNPVPTSSPYGSAPNFVVGQPGPTLTIYASDYVSNPSWANPSNYPYVEMCSNSPTTFNQPIVIAERYVTDFSPKNASNVYQANIEQTLNIVLPSGFQFITSKLPKVNLIGTDFNSPNASVSFLNTTILSIRYRNSYSSNGTSLDRIEISNIVVEALVSDVGGNIQNLGGNAFGIEYLGYIASISPDPIEFTNSYSVRNKSEFNQPPISFDGSVNFIPDNYIDPDLDENAVRLLPLPPAGDYGLSIFQGLGRADDKLVLSAVDKNSAFSISMIHTDNNGCSTTRTTQYLVYDHTAAIPGVVNTKEPDANKRIKKAIYNPNAPLGLAANPIVLADSISRNGLAGFKLLNLTAKVPSYATRYDSTKQVAALTDQILFDSIGTPWNNLIRQIPELKNSQYDFALGDSTRSFFQNFDYIHNARSLSGGTIPNPYVWFVEPLTQRRKRPFRGGSLGKIEFTGLYQSTADVTLKSPIRQELELFIPAIPVVEHVTEPSRTLGGPLGTPVFCASVTGDAADVYDIQLAGYPQAAAGLTTGFFTIYDSALYANAVTKAQIAASKLSTTSADFTDNGNGTAALKSSFHNDGKTMRVEYTLYEAIDSVWTGKGHFFMRIAPNPIGNFRFISPQALLSNALRTDDIYQGRPVAINSYCEDNTIAFINRSAFPPNYTGTNTTTLFTWDLGDPLKARSSRGGPLGGPLDSVHFVYSAAGQYTIKFQARSNYGCISEEITKTVEVGAIPSADFSMNGYSVASPVVVDGTTPTLPRRVTVQSLPGSTSTLLTNRWFFGDSTVVAANADPRLANYYTKANHTYARPGHYRVTLKAATRITDGDTLSITRPGCEILYSRPVIIVPSLSSAVLKQQYTDNFESIDPLQKWQVSDTTIGQGVTRSSWVQGTPNKSKMKTSVGNDVWFTNNANGKYNPSEQSFLYSPSFDFSLMRRPMVSFDRYTYMAANDGVVLEFSVDTMNVADPAKRWFRVGTSNDGTNWYTKGGLASKPGDQFVYPDNVNSFGDYGWADTLSMWQSSRHTLNPDIPAVVPQTHVIFRFALASVNDTDDPNAPYTAEGFALDNFRVGERTRIVLLENFVNTGNTSAAEKQQADFLIGNFNPGGTPLVTPNVDYVKLNYHTSFPANDPFNLDNPSDPSGRALYYNVATTPVSRMDGFAGNQVTSISGNLLSDWGKSGYDQRTLDLAEAKLKFVQADASNADGEFRIQVKVSAISPLAADTTVLHVVLAERGAISLSPATPSGETTFEYVVKKMLPNASGTKLPNALDADPLTETDSSYTFDLLSWVPVNLRNPANDMVVIAFLQNAETKKVLQAATVAINDPANVITAIDDPMDPEKISVYPNPADEALHVVLPVPTTTDIQVRLADQMGRLTHQLVVPKGEQQVTLQTGSNSAGVYILLMDLGNGKVARRKVIINHNE